jgi:hypothetical protein
MMKVLSESCLSLLVLQKVFLAASGSINLVWKRGGRTIGVMWYGLTAGTGASRTLFCERKWDTEGNRHIRLKPVTRHENEGM